MTTSNYSIYAIPAFWLIAIAPHAYSSALIRRGTNGRLDNANPRGASFAETYRKSLDRATFGKVERAKAAEANAFENLPVFAAAVICGNMAGLDVGTLNALSGAILGLRVAYTFLYIGVESQGLSHLRSLTWVASVGCCMTLLIKAGNVLANGTRMAL